MRRRRCGRALRRPRAARCLLPALACLALGLGHASIGRSGGRTLYVDNKLPVNCLGSYNPAARACGSGTATAYRTLADGAAATQPGDTLRIRGGTFEEPLIPPRSGQPGLPITFCRHEREEVVITGPHSPAIDISRRSYLVLRGLQVQNVTRWLHARNAEHNTIVDCVFRKATDTGGSSKTGVFFEDARFNRVLGNRLEDSTQDNLSLIHSDHNVVQGNYFLKARHALWALKCSRYNVIRDNYFHNTLEKIGEIYDCDGVGFDHTQNRLNASGDNLVEGNRFACTPSSKNASPYAGIQYAGQRGIIRRNTFYDCVGPALDLTLYGREARYNTDNRIYHNVFAASHFAGVALAAGDTSTGNVFQNNVLAGNRFAAEDTRWRWYVGELNGRYVQVMTGRTEGFSFRNNLFFGSVGGDEPYVITHGRRDAATNPPQRGLAWWQAEHPSLFADNIEADPRFRSVVRHDFVPSSGSPLIDAGGFLTRAVGAGAGKSLRVADVAPFYDGYGIPGEQGDEIQLEGQSRRTRILAIDAASQLLRLRDALQWRDGQGVHLSYSGTRPDIGVFEVQPRRGDR